MPGDLPDYYFRVRENGAVVFRVDTENRQRRIELEPIAVANLRKLTPDEIARIKLWLAERTEVLAQRDVDDIHRAVDHLNLTAQWVQTRATDVQLEDVTDALLLAMHDLRTVLVRRKAERLSGGTAEE